MKRPEKVVLGGGGGGAAEAERWVWVREAGSGGVGWTVDSPLALFPHRILHPTTTHRARSPHRGDRVANCEGGAGACWCWARRVASARPLHVSWLFLKAHWNRAPRRSAARGQGLHADSSRSLAFSLVEKQRPHRVYTDGFGKW